MLASHTLLALRSNLARAIEREDGKIDLLARHNRLYYLISTLCHLLLCGYFAIFADHGVTCWATE